MTLIDQTKSTQAHSAPPYHGVGQRGLDDLPRSSSHEGRFGRMFRTLPPFEPDREHLFALAETMSEASGETADVEKAMNAPSNHKTLAAGYTYLGQFIDHDLTFDPTSHLQRENDPNALHNFRTPRFDLDSLYGSGPADSPFLYQLGEDDQGCFPPARTRAKFLIGQAEDGQIDLPRNSAGRALTGDPRNDENLILSQLHLAFLHYHNQVVDALAALNVPDAELFAQARRVVRWHYQWLVLHDFLPRIVSTTVIADILKNEKFSIEVEGKLKKVALPKADLKFFYWREQPYIPVEFAVAAYRFGHSLVRNDYALNERLAGENELPLFASNPVNPNCQSANDLHGFRRRPAGTTIDWRFFFGDPAEPKVQLARAIDTQIVHALTQLPAAVASSPSSLAARNLLRGRALGLPTGQDVARAMGIPKEYIVSLDNSKYKFRIGTGYKLPGGEPDPSVPLRKQNASKLEGIFGNATPLWYYILKEAELIGNGQVLGPVGGRIVAEVFVGLLTGDSSSFLRVEPAWQPSAGEFGCRRNGQFGVFDLIQYGMLGR